MQIARTLKAVVTQSRNTEAENYKMNRSAEVQKYKIQEYKMQVRIKIWQYKYKIQVSIKIWQYKYKNKVLIHLTGWATAGLGLDPWAKRVPASPPVSWSPFGSGCAAWRW